MKIAFASAGKSMASTALAAIVAAGASPANAAIVESFHDRSLRVYVPTTLPAPGTRALVVVLHGALGNAQRIESGESEAGLKLDAEAQRDGFVVAYLNGTPVSRIFGADKLGWNAGGCCGVPAENGVDDVGYIEGAVGYLAAKYGIDPNRVFGIGHSNGAMMTQRIICETNLYAAGIAISGPLELDTTTCSGARGKRILAIHGADDENVPVAGGRGPQGLSRTDYVSENRSRQILTNAGAAYDLEIVPGADHKLSNVEDALRKIDGQTIAQKAAKFFGLAK